MTKKTSWFGINLSLFSFAFMAIFLCPSNVFAGTETRITYNESDTSNNHSSISGNKIVWSNIGGRGIALFDLETGIQIQFRREHNSSESYNNPLISGNNIAWLDNRDGHYNVYLYNLTTQIETKVTSEGTDKQDLMMADNKLVWLEYTNNTWDVYVYDLATQVKMRLTFTGRAGEPFISGDKVVWSERRNNDTFKGNNDIFMYNLNTHTETRITNDIADQFNPVIADSKIVWFDSNWREGNFINLYSYDTVTQSGGYIGTHLGEGGMSDPIDANGSKVVWSDTRNGKGDIYVYDTLTGIVTQITTDLTNQVQPAISENKIVWSDYRNFNSDGGNRWDIYWYDINPNLAPVSNISSDSIATLGHLASLDGSGSTDADGTIVSYDWNFGDGGTASGVSVNHVYATAGTYQVTLIVTDDDGATASTTMNVRVNTPPTVSIVSVGIINIGESVTFDGSDSTDVEGPLVSYLWNFGDGTSGNGITATHSYTQSGTYQVILTVTDSDGSVATTSQIVTVNATPVAVITPISNVILGEISGFDASGSSDSDGNIVAYNWDFGDVSSGNGINSNHTYATAGTYQVTLTVIDNHGVTATVSATALVQTPDQAIDDLRDIVRDMNLTQGISNSLDTKLQNVTAALQAANSGNRGDAINKLQAFINAVQAQSGNKLTVVQANELIAAAQRIIDAL